MGRAPKRPRDPNQLAKMIVDLAATFSLCLLMRAETV